MLLHFGAASALVALSLAGGMLGYTRFEDLDWRAAFLNASMLLGGMGPVDAPKTDGGKVFAGAYALYCGLVFIVTIGILLTPVIHRLMHHFHWTEKET
jgi:hypothetical protein